MGRRAPSSARDQRERARRLASDFQATVLHNMVHERVQEDTQLELLLDAATAVDHAHRERELEMSDDAACLTHLSKAEGKTLHVSRNRSLEVVAKACAAVIRDGEEWVAEGHYDGQAVGEATAEARAWLREHTNPAARADVLGVLSADEDAEEVPAE